MSSYYRLSLLVIVTALGLGLSLLLKPPAAWLSTFLLVGVVCVGTDRVVRAHPDFRALAPAFPPALWILPSLLILGSALLLRQVPEEWWRIAGVGAAALLFVVVLLAEYRSINPTDKRFALARFVLHVATYLVGASFFITIFHLDLGKAYNPLAVGVVSLLLALELFRESTMETKRVWLYAAIVSLILAEIGLALGYLPVSGLLSGVSSLLIFYLLTGLIQSHFAYRLTKGTVTEFLIVTSIGLAFLYTRGLS